jgi:single-stranded-DNA-specific exonuclease
MKISNELLRYLSLKGITDPHEQRRFLLPQLTDHYDPFCMNGMDKAVEELRRALKEHLRILVWGHADLDGIASAAMLKFALEDLGAEEVRVRIPSDDVEGFGLISDELREFKVSGVDLVVTVDVGITNVAEAELARELGLGLIITDHHELMGEVPDTIVINPKLPDSGYPWRLLAGAGVVLKLVCALYQYMVGMSVEELACLRPHYWMFAALGTISDRCPLLDENRLIVRVGLDHIRADEWPSLGIWLKEMGFEAERLTVFDLYSRAISVFYAADPEEAVGILLSKDRRRLGVRYAELRESAIEWQRGKQWMIEEAERAARHIGGMVISVSEDIGQAYLGTTTHALRERYNRPAIVLAPKGKLWHAECRGLEEVDLLEYLSQFESIFLTFGGHRKACGFTLESAGLEEFLSAVEANPIKVPPSQDKEGILFELDIETDLKDWSLLAPFGEGNYPPRLLAQGVRIEEAGEGYRANGILVYLPFALRPLPQPEGKFDMEYTVKADGTIRVLHLEPIN